MFVFLVFLEKAAGLAIGIVGDAGVRANAQQDKIFVGMILILIFAEALGLYGLIIALILSQWWSKFCVMEDSNKYRHTQAKAINRKEFINFCEIYSKVIRQQAERKIVINKYRAIIVFSFKKYVCMRVFYLYPSAIQIEK